MSPARLARYAIADKCGLIFMHFSGIFSFQLLVLCPARLFSLLFVKNAPPFIMFKQGNIRRCCATCLWRKKGGITRVVVKSMMSNPPPVSCWIHSVVYVCVDPTPVIKCAVAAGQITCWTKSKDTCADCWKNDVFLGLRGKLLKNTEFTEFSFYSPLDCSSTCPLFGWWIGNADNVTQKLMACFTISSISMQTNINTQVHRYIRVCVLPVQYICKSSNGEYCFWCCVIK